MDINELSGPLNLNSTSNLNINSIGLGSSPSSSTNASTSSPSKKTNISLSSSSSAVTVIQQQPTVIKKRGKRLAKTLKPSQQLENEIGGTDGDGDKLEEKATVIKKRVKPIAKTLKPSQQLENEIGGTDGDGDKLEDKTTVIKKRGKRLAKTPSQQLENEIGGTDGDGDKLEEKTTFIKKRGKRLAKTPSQQLENEIGGTDGDKWEEKTGDLLCPICFEEFKHPHITKCGHTYCQECIINCLEVDPRCPNCRVIVKIDELIPDSLLNTIIVAKKEKDKRVQTEETTRKIEYVDFIRDFTNDDFNDLIELNGVLTELGHRKESLTATATLEDIEHQSELKSEFLKEILQIKKARAEQLEREIEKIQTDLNYVNTNPNFASTSTQSANSILLDHHQSDLNMKKGLQEVAYSELSSLQMACNSTYKRRLSSKPSAFEIEQSSMASRRRRVHSHFEELSEIYLQTRNIEIFGVRQTDTTGVPKGRTECNFETLNEFTNTVMRTSRFYGVKPLSILPYNMDFKIINSIDFDKDNEFFAIAGGLRNIKLFEYPPEDFQFQCPMPSGELLSTGIIVCVAWSIFYKNYLASSDYFNGSVCLWDVSTTAKIRLLEEHIGRVRSVNWSSGDPHIFASGSDDAKVKLWSINSEKSVLTLEARSRVNCVEFCPENRFLIAFGSIDNCVYYHDLRNPREPLGILNNDHNRAVVTSVKFVSKNELVSTSVSDFTSTVSPSTNIDLKLWNLETMDCVRSFREHSPEKFILRLTTDGNYIVVGSKNNLHVYYKQLTKPLFSYRFDNVIEGFGNDDPSKYLSALAWKKGSPVILAACQGSIKILELV